MESPLGSVTESDKEKDALGRFFRELLLEIHQEDPNHPVVFASSHLYDLPYLKTYAPTLDAVGFNGPRRFSATPSAGFRWQVTHLIQGAKGVECHQLVSTQ